jgi:hypothetical protein
MEDLRELQRFQIEALQKENASLKSQIKEATELLKEILNDLQS